MTSITHNIDELLEMEPARFVQAVQQQPPAMQEVIRQEIINQLNMLDAAAWGHDRKLRGHYQAFTGAKFDYERLEQTQQWLAAQFHEAFHVMFADGAAAAAHCWAYEQQHGTAQTARVLRHTPQVFGRLRGFRLLGYQSPSRRAARQRALVFDFAAYRLVFNLATLAGKNLLDALRETARVASA